MWFRQEMFAGKFRILRSVFAACLGVLLGLGWAGSAQASVVVQMTRVIVPAERGEATVRVRNSGNMPALVQSWIDENDPTVAADEARTPFLITPPIVRIDAQRDQSLRVLYVEDPNNPLPTDRESVFRLNVLEVPAKARDVPSDANVLRFAFRSRLKLFYRPAGLPGTANAAGEQLVWHASHANGTPILVARNPTPYHVTVSKLEIVVDGEAHKASTGMVEPFGELAVRLPPEIGTPPESGWQIRFVTLDDIGSSAEHQAIARR